MIVTIHMLKEAFMDQCLSGLISPMMQRKGFIVEIMALKEKHASTILVIVVKDNARRPVKLKWN